MLFLGFFSLKPVRKRVLPASKTLLIAKSRVEDSRLELVLANSSSFLLLVDVTCLKVSEFLMFFLRPNLQAEYSIQAIILLYFCLFVKLT